VQLIVGILGFNILVPLIAVLFLPSALVGSYLHLGHAVV
jgi:hypothetical protein